jgi:23S rRNA (adenine2503-C2)-methyltransferase
MTDVSPAAAPLPDLTDMTREELTKFLVDAGQPRFRGDQVFRWIWEKLATSFEEMSDLPAPLRKRLAEIARLGGVALEKSELSRDGTRKYLVRLGDGRAVEAVLIPEESRMTLCISSQVGCALACAFCATGTMGLTRNLTPGEIAGQVALAVRELRKSPHPGHPDRERPVTNVVYMGMGEPLHNYDAVVKSLAILTDEKGLAFAARRITVSTVGLVPQMRALGEAFPVTLAVSLHAPNDVVRGRIMPINKKYDLAAVIAACREFPLKARARITFEYVLLAGVNDSLEDADQLALAISGLRCKVNLIPWNPIPTHARRGERGPRAGLPSADGAANEHEGAAFKRPSDVAIGAFAQRLDMRGVTCMVRTTRGRDIAAACGQLALKEAAPA